MKIWASGDVKCQRFLDRVERRFGEVLPSAVEDRVRRVVEAVRRRGDRALLSYVRRLDLAGLAVGEVRLRGNAGEPEHVDEEFVRAVELALANLRAFHEPQVPKGYTIEQEGNDLSMRVRPLDSLGIYVAGRATASLSSLLMAVVPARLAGVRRIAVATPPRNFVASAELRYLLERLDLHEVYLMGGPHAVAALAYGTESVAPVDKITGPGGRWMTAAKRAVAGAVGVDLVSGPPELVVVADAHAEPAIVAADLLAQAENDADALTVLVTTSRSLAEKVGRALAARLRSLPGDAPARIALRRWGALVTVGDLEEAVAVANRIAPEHVELLVEDPRRWLDGIERAGAVYLGPWSATALADFVVGSSNLLPSAGAARFASPLGVWDFVTRTAVVRVAPHRYPVLAKAARAVADVEGLPLHGEALAAGSRGRV